MHSAERHAGYIRQCLSQDKAPIGFFLSAGCPVSIQVPGPGGSTPVPLIPDIAGMTTRVREVLSASELADVFELLTGSFAEGRTGNIEELLSRVRALSVVVGDGEIHGLSQGDLAAIEQALTRSVADLVSVDLPEQGGPYRRLASWAGDVPRSIPIEIFTTNYDLLAEQALESVRVPYFDGFVGSHAPFFDVAAIEQDALPTRWVRLWKLHGSLNWRRDKRGTVTRVSGGSRSGDVLIHPSHLKYDQSRRMPYLAMIDRLRAFLRQRGAALLICGYSFNDDHLNEVIVQGLEGNPTAAAFGLLFGNLNDYPTAQRLAQRRSNLSLLAADGAVVGTTRGGWTDEHGKEGALAAPGLSRISNAPFRLGDFSAFGELLAEMIGQLPDEPARDVG